MHKIIQRSLKLDKGSFLFVIKPKQKPNIEKKRKETKRNLMEENKTLFFCPLPWGRFPSLENINSRRRAWLELL
jgi:hypothetical protein